MRPVLCIDFGTSSIRAVMRDAIGDIKVLPIGQVTDRQEIDGASIPSAVSIDEDGQTIRFGQHAREAIVNGKRLAFWSSSPKLWLKEPRRLSAGVAPGVNATRRDLLTGLLAYSLFAADQTGIWRIPSNPDGSTIRVAHPVWPASIKEDADRAVRQMAWLAANMASAGDWGETSVDVLTSWTTPEHKAEVVPEMKDWLDTVEPVAAAVELLPSASNRRRLCLVIDVGAGTTDIGVFQQAAPDHSVKKPTKLIPAGPTTSVFKAGDSIDEALTLLIGRTYPAEYKRVAGEIRTNIRSYKESIFEYGRLQVVGTEIDITLREFEATEEVQAIAAEVRKGLEQCMRDAINSIERWFATSASLERRILVVMAGGGAGIGFLRRAVSAPLLISGMRYEFDVTSPSPPTALNMHGAGYSRLAVGMGGASHLYDTVIHEHEKLLGVSSLGAPKQVVGNWLT